MKKADCLTPHQRGDAEVGELLACAESVRHNVVEGQAQHHKTHLAQIIKTGGMWTATGGRCKIRRRHSPRETNIKTGTDMIVGR